MRSPMYNHDFIKIAGISPRVYVGDPKKNIIAIKEALKDVKASMVVFPELALTGYSASDMFFQSSLLNASMEALKDFITENTFKGTVILGGPFSFQGLLYNVAYVIRNQAILGIVPKIYLPNTQEYYEKRWFTTGLKAMQETRKVTLFGQSIPFGSLLFESEDLALSFGVEICEDMWAPFTPGNYLALKGAKMIFNLSASNETFGKSTVRKRTVIEHSRKNMGAYIYVSAGASESTAETVFSGHIVASLNGRLIIEEETFNFETKIRTFDIDLATISYARNHYSSYRDIKINLDYEIQKVPFESKKSENFNFETPFDQTPFVPKKNLKKAFEKLSQIQIAGLYKRLEHIKSKTIIVGVSGGLDSTLALFVAVKTMLKRGLSSKDVMAVTMPAKATSQNTYSQAHDLMKALNVTTLEIPIEKAVKDHLDQIHHDESLDTTYENAHARMRTLILMDLANQHHGIVLGTGDLSELALGFATYNGDQMSMYGINQGLPKTLVRFMVLMYGQYGFNQDLRPLTEAIANTPISPELIPGQESEKIIGSYTINDFIIERFLRHGDDEERMQFLIEKTFNLEEKEARLYIKRFFKRFYSQQFKRQASPDAPKIIDISLSPRTDFRLPSDISYEGSDE